MNRFSEITIIFYIIVVIVIIVVKLISSKNKEQENKKHEILENSSNKTKSIKDKQPSKFEIENERFRKMYNAMSQEDKNKIAGIENPRTKEEEEALVQEARRISRHLEEKHRKECSYFLYKECLLAKGNFQSGFVWFNNGEWIEDDDKTLGLRDSMMDYGDASSFDYIHISGEWAEKLIQNGTAVLEGQVSSSEKLDKPLTVNLKDWKKPEREA